MAMRHDEPNHSETGLALDEAALREQQRLQSRRRLLTMAAATPTALIAMGSRPAWATACLSPSAYASVHPHFQATAINSSATPTNTSSSTVGCGHTRSAWSGCYNNRSAWNCYQGNYSCPQNSNFHQIVGRNQRGSNSCFGQLFHSSSNTTDQDFCAAYLSACNSGRSQVCANYPLTTANVCDMYAGTFKVNGVTWTQSECHQYILSLANDSGCHAQLSPSRVSTGYY
jgi:hypothetical protein